MRRDRKGRKVKVLLILQGSSLWLELRVDEEEIYNIYFETRKIFLRVLNPQFFLALKSVKSQRMLTQ